MNFPSFIVPCVRGEEDYGEEKSDKSSIQKGG